MPKKNERKPMGLLKKTLTVFIAAIAGLLAMLGVDVFMTREAPKKHVRENVYSQDLIKKARKKMKEKKDKQTKEVKLNNSRNKIKVTPKSNIKNNNDRLKRKRIKSR